MKMIRCSAVLAAAVLAVGCSCAEDSKPAAPAAPVASAKLSKSVPKGWGEDLAAAKAQAAKEGKKILMAFSGSDWCGWCVRMDRDVYSKPEFIEKAKKDYVLVMIDNPQDTSILSPLAAAQNGRLTREFGIRGFPSTLVLDAEGKVLKRLSGYKGSPEALFEALDGK